MTRGLVERDRGPAPSRQPLPRLAGDPGQAVLAQQDRGRGEPRVPEVGSVADPLQPHLAGPSVVDGGVHAQVQLRRLARGKVAVAGRRLELRVHRAELGCAGGTVRERELVGDGGRAERHPGGEDERERPPWIPPRAAGGGAPSPRAGVVRCRTRRTGRSPAARGATGRPPRATAGASAGPRFWSWLMSPPSEGTSRRIAPSASHAIAAKARSPRATGGHSDRDQRDDHRSERGDADGDVHGTARPVPEEHEAERDEPQGGQHGPQDPKLDRPHPHAPSLAMPGDDAAKYPVTHDSRVIERSGTSRAHSCPTAPRCSTANRTPIGAPGPPSSR